MEAQGGGVSPLVTGLRKQVSDCLPGYSRNVDASAAVKGARIGLSGSPYLVGSATGAWRRHPGFGLCA